MRVSQMLVFRADIIEILDLDTNYFRNFSISIGFLSILSFILNQTLTY